MKSTDFLKARKENNNIITVGNDENNYDKVKESVMNSARNYCGRTMLCLLKSFRMISSM